MEKREINEEDEFRKPNININYLDLDPYNLQNILLTDKISLYVFFTKYYKEYINKYKHKNLDIIMFILSELKIQKPIIYIIDNISKEEFLTINQDLGLEGPATKYALDKGYIDIDILKEYFEYYKDDINAIELISTYFNLFKSKLDIIDILILNNLINTTIYFFNNNFFDISDYNYIIVFSFMNGNLDLLKLLINLNKEIYNIKDNILKSRITCNIKDVDLNSMINILLLTDTDTERETIYNYILKIKLDSIYHYIYNVHNHFNIDHFDNYNKNLQAIKIFNMLVFDDHIILFIQYENGIQEEIRLNIIINKNVNRIFLNHTLKNLIFHINDYKLIYFVSYTNKIISLERIIKNYEQEMLRPIMIIPTLTDNAEINGIIITYHL